MDDTGTRFAARLIAWRWWLLATAVVLAAAAWRPAGALDFDRSIENMFVTEDTGLAAYRQLKQTFGGNEIVLAVYEDPALLETRGIDRLAQISAALLDTPGVAGVLSLATLDEAIQPILRIRYPLSRQEVRITGDSELAMAFRKMFVGYTHSADGQLAAVVCLLDTAASTPRRETVDQLRIKIQSLADGEVIGEAVMVTDGFRHVEEDGRRLGSTCVLLLAATILLCFRSIRWMIVPALIVQLTLLLTRATLTWAGLKLSMVSSMLTAIVTVVATAMVVHVIVRFREFRNLGHPASDALKQTLRVLAVPIAWACVTDAVGFAALLIADVGPVHDFGIMMATGSLLVMVSLILLLPGLVLIGSYDRDPHQAWGERYLDLQLAQLVDVIQQRPGLLAGIAVIVTLLAGAGITQLEVETDFTKNFRANSPIVRGYDTAEERLGGAGIWDIVLPAEKTLEPEYLDRVLALQDRLRTELSGQSLRVLSWADAIEASTPSAGRNLVVPLAQSVMARQMPTFTKALHGQDPDSGRYYYRIMLRSPERRSADEKNRLIADVRRISAEAFPAAEVTGFYVLLAKLIDSITRDQWTSFAAAIAGIGITMLIAFRSFRLAAIAMVPNVAPIFIVTGAMGWSGTKINMGAAMIAAVSLGLSIDSSIHYIFAFQRERRAGQRVISSILAVQQRVGRALVFSTLALIVGFAVLTTSQFIPTVYFGLLVCLTMLGGLLGNLVVLPLLLRLQAEDRDSA